MKLLRENTIAFFKVVFAFLPPYLLLLIFYPFIVGAFIDYPLIEFRQIVIQIVWLIIILIPYFFWKRSLFLIVGAILFFINGFVNLSSWILIGSPISASSLFVLFNTNLNEAAGFAQLKFNFAYFTVIPYFFIFFFALRHHPIKTGLSKQKRILFSLCICLFAVLFLVDNIIHHRFIRKSTPTLVKSFVSFNHEIQAFKTLKKESEIGKKSFLGSVTPSVNRQVIVLIMGESLNRNHMSLYGYHRKTNPLLSKVKNLIVYDDVISGYSNTLQSVPHSLSEANLVNGLEIGEGTNLIELFKAAGYKTYWLSNQSPLGAWDNLITLFAEQSDVVQFDNISSSSSFEGTYKQSYDEVLFSTLKKQIRDTAQHKFIVIHLMGCHSTYSSRYPSRFDVFKGDGSSHQETIAEYDNAVLYNDFVVDSLLKITKKYCKSNQMNGVVVYVSDHGENVYDEGGGIGHSYAGRIPDANVEIPFLVWVSPTYQDRFPQKYRLIQKHKSFPFVTDDLFYGMIDLAQLKTNVFEPQRSIFNSSYNKNRKRILVDGHEYN